MTRKNIFAMNPRHLPTRSEVEVAVWEERDRLHIHIRDRKTQQRTIAEWWDDDARQMFEDGFFKGGRDLEKSVLDYAEEMGLIASNVRRNIFLLNNPGGARRNIFAMNNPGKEQAWLAEQFVKGANSGVASSMYIHGNVIYSYGPHFPIAIRREDPKTGHPEIVVTTRKAPSRTTAGHIGLVVRAAQNAGIWVVQQAIAPEALGPAGYSNPLTRREAARALAMGGGEMGTAGMQRSGRLSAHFKGRAYGHFDSVSEFGPRDMRQDATILRSGAAVFRNAAGEGRGSLERLAKSVGLYFETWAPGDGVTRYRFFTKPTDYHAGDGIYTALGLKEAWCFVRGYAASKTGARGNPASAAGQDFISEKIGTLVREGYPQKQAIAIAYSMARKGGYRVPARQNCCSNPAENPLIRGDKLPHNLRQQVLAGYIYRWTTGNTQRGYAWSSIPKKDWPRIPLISDEEWLRTHAFHVTKSGKLDARRHHAEPHYLSDDARSNPLLQTVLLANPKRRGAATKRTARRTRVITTRTTSVKKVVGNPGGAIRIPFREGQKIPIERARAWVRSLRSPELLRQFEDAERLQTKANKKPRFVIWKTLPIGSTKQIEMVTSFAHYGESPETMYKPPKGSRKGRHMYRHEWGDGSGRPRPVPVLAAPSGKAIIKVMGPGQKTGDWMRG